MIFRKKLPAFFFLAVYLFSAAVGNEFLKLPLLVEHYFDHVEENNGIAFTTFLFQHYYEEDGTDEDAAEDSRLPFKSPENNVLSFVSLKPPPDFLPGYKTTPGVKKNLRIRNDRFLSSQYLNVIWQPPRYCFYS